MAATTLVPTLVLGQIVLAASAVLAAEPGRIEGVLVDSKDRITNPGEAVVLLCDSKTGRPIDGRTGLAATVSLRDDNKAIDSFRTATTDANGRFEFADVSPGNYRLVAQSWSGTKGLPPVMGETSTTVILHGVANDVEVRAGEDTRAFIRELGKGVLHITNDPEEGHAFLLISLKPTLGDGVLGPYGWGDDFLRELVGYTHMDKPYVTIVGLPEDRDVHVGLLNYDNSPGVGAASFKAGQREGTIRIIAGWSNGHQDPPPELAELTDYVAQHKLTAREFLKASAGEKARDPQWDLLNELRAEPDREVEVKGLGKRRLADVLAALGYARMRAAARK